MLDAWKLLVVARSVNAQLTRFNDLFERYLTYQRADLILHGVVLDTPPEAPTVQSVTDLYARTEDLVEFDQERQALARAWGREPSDEDVLAHLEQRDRVG
jgi:hypothetical protein